jgi:hypothetical protein
MPAIFISYRREDSIAYSGRLFDRLTAEFGKGQVFMDIDSIDPGADFIQEIERTVAACDAVLVVIGKQWLTVVDAQGRRRIENPEDFVRLEVETALSRKVRVVPVLVGGAQMPRSDELPSTLGGLLRRHALDLPDTAFHQALERLITSIRRDEAKAREQADQERVAHEAKAWEQQRPAPEAKSREHAAQRENRTNNAASPATVIAPVRSRWRRWLLLYKPSRKVAWLPRVFFYYFAAFFVIVSFIDPAPAVEASLILLVFLFRYLSIRLDRPLP